MRDSEKQKLRKAENYVNNNPFVTKVGFMTEMYD